MDSTIFSSAYSHLIFLKRLQNYLSQRNKSHIFSNNSTTAAATKYQEEKKRSKAKLTYNEI